MPSLLLINQFYYPDHSATSQILQQLAEGMARRGFEMTVLTGNARYEGGRLARRWKENYNGVSIVRVPSTRFGKTSSAGRLVDYLSFHLMTFVRLLLLQRFDVVVTLTTPPLIGWVGSAAKFFKKSRFAYWVQDLYPEVAVALGILREHSWLYRICRAISTGILQSADAVVVVGKGMAEKIKAARVAVRKTQIIQNWADEESISPVCRTTNEFLEKHQLDGKFIVLYAGNFGRAHVFNEVMEAAASLKQDNQIQFVFVGSGNRKSEILAATKRNQLGNVRLLGYEPLEQLGAMLSAASLGLVTQAPETAGLAVPSKLYGLMAAGRPIAFIGPAHCDAAQIVREAECGFAIEFGGVARLVDAIRRLQADPGLGEQLGRAGREWFLHHASKSLAMEAFGSLFEELVHMDLRQEEETEPVEFPRKKNTRPIAVKQNLRGPL